MTYYIVDNEDKPVISFDTDASNSLSSGAENSVSSPTITVKQDRRSIFASTINYSADPSSGSASALILADYTKWCSQKLLQVIRLQLFHLRYTSETKFETDETVIIALDGSSVSSNTTLVVQICLMIILLTLMMILKTLNFTFTRYKRRNVILPQTLRRLMESATINVSLSAISGVATSVTYTIASGSGASSDKWIKYCNSWSDYTTDYDSDASTNII